MSAKRVVVAMAGAHGLGYGVQLLADLHELGWETHVVLAEPARLGLRTELAKVRELADELYSADNQAARISSGSFLTRGMIVAPCDAWTLASIKRGLAADLVLRAADVTLKEARPLVLAVPAGAVAETRGGGEVPGLVVTMLDGPVETAVARLLAQFSALLSTGRS